MSCSLGSKKTFWERNARLGHEKGNKRGRKGVPVSHTYIPSSELASAAGRLVEEQQGE